MPKIVLSGTRLDTELATPVGPYSHGVIARGARTLYIAGQIGVDSTGQLVGDDYPSQYAQILVNIRLIVEAAGGRMSDVCSLIHYITTPLTSTDDAYAAIKRVREDFFTSEYPSSTVVQVVGLMDPSALIEVDARAALD